MSETVVLAVRPQVAEEVFPGSILSRPDRHQPDRRVFDAPCRGARRPADRIWRAIPLPSAAQRSSPIAVYPPGGAAAELFAPLGQVFGIE